VAERDGDNRHNTSWNREKDGLHRRAAETVSVVSCCLGHLLESEKNFPFDYSRLETTDSSICYIGGDSDQIEHPRVRILQTLNHLTGLGRLVLNTGLVAPQSLDCIQFLCLRHSPSHWVVRQE
jgi:hypothetical protein